MEYSAVKGYLGNPKQLFRVDDYCLNGGRAKGMRMFHVRNGAGMEWISSVDRCMDLHYLYCKGHSLGFLTCAGDVAPYYYDDRGFEWMKSFTAGFMTTCGLCSIGLPASFQGRELGLHGHASNLPAEEASFAVTETAAGPAATLRGVMRDARPTGENLSLTRVITAEYGSPRIHIRDTVRNDGFEKTLHMILYHFNIGYPLLTENTRLLLPSRRAIPRDSAAAAHPDAWKVLTPPVDGLPEMCYYHDIISKEDGSSFVAAYNAERKIGVAIRFNTTLLDHFVQWRQLTKGYYAMGLEPCNATIDGAADAVAKGLAKYLAPQEEIDYHITLELLSGDDDFERLQQEYAAFAT